MHEFGSVNRQMNKYTCNEWSLIKPLRRKESYHL
jgi:hypothetical protein